MIAKAKAKQTRAPRDTITASNIEAIANTWDGPGRTSKIVCEPKPNWHPDHNKTQKAIFDDATLNILAAGEKGSGKSWVMGDKMIRHCYENRNAFQMCIAPSIFTGKEGIWQELELNILPRWKEGIGLDYTASALDPETKDRHRWIGNRFGEWSKIVLKSIPHASYLEARIKGPTPSGVYVEELTQCNSRDYFEIPAAQLGRRQQITGPQQFTASCNPAGPSNWVYHVFYSEVVDPETGVRDPDYAAYHVPVIENLHRLPPGYIERLKKVFKDPTRRRQLIDGEWVDSPTGESIFKDQFVPGIHVKGDALRGTGLRPVKGFPIECGWDPGTANFAVSFGQFLEIKGKLTWLVFDELNFVGKNRSYKFVVNRVLETMEYWNKMCETRFSYVHIGDEAAFTTRRADGSYDCLDIERFSGGKIKMRACPKGHDTIVARVRMVQNFLEDEALFISAKCQNTIDTLTLLASKRAKNGEHNPNLAFMPIRSKYMHQFDAMSYSFWYYYTKARRPTRNEILRPQIYTAGSRT